jgi:hypothetical protein
LAEVVTAAARALNLKISDADVEGDDLPGLRE